MEQILVIGAGGHAHSVLEVLLESGQPYEVIGIVDKEYKAIGSLYGIPLIGDMSFVPEVFKSGVRNAVIASGFNITRKKIAQTLSQFHFPKIISKNALVGYSVSIDEGSIIMPGACLRMGVRIGKHCIINTNASVDHECIVGDYVHIAPGSALSGRVVVGEGVFLGTGTCVIDKIKVGEWSTVGAGGVVVKELPPNTLAVGVPAKVIREINVLED